MTKKWKQAVAGLLAASMILAGCSVKTSQSGSAAQAEGSSSGGKIKIAIVPKVVGIPYFNASETGAKKAGQDLGVDVIYTGPTQADAAQQVKIIEDLISQKVDVIAVAPNDPASLTPVLKRAKDQGIHVMDWDTPADQSVVELSVHQIDDEIFGRTMMDKLVEKIGSDSGEFAILTGGMSAANLNTWIGWAKKQAEEKYPNMKLVNDKIATDEKQQVAYQKTLDLLKAYPDLKGLLAFSTVAPLGAAQAIQEKGLQGKVAVIGASLPTDSKPYILDGSMSSALLWNPENLGYLTVSLAKNLEEGKLPANGDDVPNVGTIQVKDDNKTVIMGPPTEFTKENVDQFKF
ncbi:autoinducer 2 ABC transporter substrate-binding protein [Paenibacillus sp. URB8-2]|uniref:autoinducer 2 ABC transporter substrate-binding protein n=1 Tax=Paenibacillus sp. URB8-2 TaxID=2741301 RepID=UPI0015B99F7C|nr:autoinducer 2 ABC transporter substrate-binding protein [Paenibacillus sp. URB8-2]BCG57574.1 periplasmic binding protein [Paenibacillus sp. URB8-2]